ncbi:PcfJ domain-containing protein [Streptococcus suis]|uniref:PcfJ domain-containing protein n=1 Tax=Streptococcus suis TaxID=1307 RepID=UPI00211CFCCB|nr:PcfJ domain-containing protein [Streptococcus suis]UUM45909.1 PcfJ domain-containing protein [Streptococcus suis]HEL2551277.1 PcfJ domain-containing protein [Streptococcus suis]
MKPEQCKREAERRLKPSKAFWDWCYSQITTYKWSNKHETIVASDMQLGYCIEKRLTKASKLTFFDKVYFFSIVLATAKRIEIQSYMFSSSFDNGKQAINFEMTNLERFEGGKHIKIGRANNDQYLPFLIENYYGSGPYTGNKFYPNNWNKQLQTISELKYIKFDKIGYHQIERLYKYRYEIEFAQKIGANRLADEIMFPYAFTRLGYKKMVDMRTLNRRWLQKNKQFFKNSDRSFSEFELARRIGQRNGKLVPGIEKHLDYQDIKHIPEGVGINKFQNWVIKNRINFREYKDYLNMLTEMGIDPEGDAMIVPKDFEAMHQHTVGLYNQFRAEQRRLQRAEQNRAQREREKQLEAEFKRRDTFDMTLAGYTFHVPSRVAELIYEGKKLHHCVSSYTERHLKGKTMIVFVRLASRPNTPLYTLEVNLGQIVQFRGKYNRDVPEEVWNVAKEWLQVTKQEKVA